MENELRVDDINFKFTKKSDREAFMDAVDRKRATILHMHTQTVQRSVEFENEVFALALAFGICNSPS